MSRRLLAAVAAAALTLGLAACGDPSEGTKTDPPPSIDIGQSDGGGDGGASDGGGDEGSTEAAPDIPAPDPADYPGMDEQTPEGAEQAFKYFWDVAIVGYMTGDPGVLAELSDPECANCEAMRVEIEELGESGGYWGETNVDFVDSSARNTSGEHQVLAECAILVGEHVEPAADGAGMKNVEASTLIATGGLDWVNGSWLVSDFASSVQSEEL
ncbi:DUF6318 family protein [Brachybacterium sp. J153]|uniref:DUF6318 family protein n=1 Tax=Brachybacterium sp. J153 TaxID=3116488 RepID=UPI002E75B8A7|nr:DUF6318 family protein [Brachybacterium sp. J153]MEE1619045.1 DUF6318 family protein [Brachybacterium sp. J153]